MVSKYTESTITIVWLNHETADSVLLFISETKSGSEEFYPVFPAAPGYLPTYEFSDLKSFTSYKIILVINGENAVYKTIKQTTRKNEHECIVCTISSWQWRHCGLEVVMRAC